jgi:hypothetical protein
MRRRRGVWRWTAVLERHLRVRRNVVFERLLLGEHVHDTVADELRDRGSFVSHLRSGLRGHVHERRLHLRRDSRLQLRAALHQWSVLRERDR